MNKHNKSMFDAIKNVEADKKQFSYFMESLPLKKKLAMILHLIFNTKRCLLILTLLHKGMSMSSAYGYAFKSEKSKVVELLGVHGWEIKNGKVA